MEENEKEYTEERMAENPYKYTNGEMLNAQMTALANKEDYMFELQEKIAQELLILKTIYLVDFEPLAIKINTLSTKVINNIYREPHKDYGVSTGELRALLDFSEKLVALFSKNIETTIVY